MSNLFGSRALLIEEIVRGAGINLPVSEETSTVPLVPEQLLSSDNAIEKAVFQSRVVKRLLGAVQYLSPQEAMSYYCEIAAKHTPALVAQFRQDIIPNSASMTIINTISPAPYCVRYLQSSEGNGLLKLHFQRMADMDPLKSDDDYAMSVAEACQFLSTLLVLYDLGHEADEPTRKKLVDKLKKWRRTYRGKFCEQMAQRCLDMLEPQGTAGGEMFMMLPMVKAHLEKGLTTCNASDCNVAEKQNLMQCARCKTVRYCGAAHQRQDWPKHKPNCFAPSH